MATLLERIKQNLTEVEQPQMLDQTEQTRKLLAAKSGKAVGPSAPASNIQEQAALGATTQQLGQVQQAGQIQATALQQQQQQQQQAEQQERAALNLQERAQVQDRENKKAQIFNELTRERGSLDLEKQAAKLEQAAHLVAFNNKQYMDRLEMEGKRQGLDNELAFREALEKAVLQDNEQLLRTSLGNQSVLNANDREWKLAMGKMNINDALQIATNALKQERQAAIIGGVQKVGQLGAEYAVGKYYEKDKPSNTGTNFDATNPQYSGLAGGKTGST